MIARLRSCWTVIIKTGFRALPSKQSAVLRSNEEGVKNMVLLSGSAVGTAFTSGREAGLSWGVREAAPPSSPCKTTVGPSSPRGELPT